MDPMKNRINVIAAGLPPAREALEKTGFLVFNPFLDANALSEEDICAAFIGRLKEKDIKKVDNLVIYSMAGGYASLAINKYPEMFDKIILLDSIGMSRLSWPGYVFRLFRQYPVMLIWHFNAVREYLTLLKTQRKKVFSLTKLIISFRSETLFARLKGRNMIAVHAKNDTLISFRQAQKTAQKYKVEIKEYPGNHFTVLRNPMLIPIFVNPD